MYVMQKQLDKDFIVTIGQWPESNPTQYSARIFNTRFNMLFASYYNDAGNGYNSLIDQANDFVNRYRVREDGFRKHLSKPRYDDEFELTPKEINRRRNAPFWYFEVAESNNERGKHR